MAMLEEMRRQFARDREADERDRLEEELRRARRAVREERAHNLQLQFELAAARMGWQ
jgi:hypothetical protein